METGQVETCPTRTAADSLLLAQKKRLQSAALARHSISRVPTPGRRFCDDGFMVDRHVAKCQVHARTRRLSAMRSAIHRSTSAETQAMVAGPSRTGAGKSTPARRQSAVRLNPVRASTDGRRSSRGASAGAMESVLRFAMDCMVPSRIHGDGMKHIHEIGND